MEFGDLVKRRRMVRKFDPRPIPDEVLRSILDVARHAPSGGFSQGFDFVVLRTPEELDWFFRTTTDPDDPDPYPGKEAGTVPAALVLPFSNKRLYLERYAQPDKIAFGMDKEENWPVPFWTVDTSMAIMLILLNAVNEGVGAWYFGTTYGEADVLRELGVPEGCEMLGVIALGYPSTEDRPTGSAVTRKRRPFEEMFHFGHW